MKAQNEIGNVKETKSLLNLSKHRVWVVLGNVIKVIYKVIALLVGFLFRTTWTAGVITVRATYMVVVGVVLSLVIKIAGAALIFWLIIY